MDVVHDNAVIRRLALDYIADLEAAVAARFSTLAIEVTVHDFQLTAVESAVKRRKKLAYPAKKS